MRKVKRHTHKSYKTNDRRKKRVGKFYFRRVFVRYHSVPCGKTVAHGNCCCIPLFTLAQQAKYLHYCIRYAAGNFILFGTDAEAFLCCLDGEHTIVAAAVVFAIVRYRCSNLHAKRLSKAALNS